MKKTIAFVVALLILFSCNHSKPIELSLKLDNTERYPQTDWQELWRHFACHHLWKENNLMIRKEIKKIITSNRSLWASAFFVFLRSN